MPAPLAALLPASGQASISPVSGIDPASMDKFSRPRLPKRPRFRLRPWLAIAALLLTTLVSPSMAGTSGLGYIYQPLTTLGTDQEAEIIIARVPALLNSVPEAEINAVALPNRLLQDSSVKVDDSNLISLLNIKIETELVENLDHHYRITVDLREMKSTEPYEVTPQQVIAALVKCLRSTFGESSYLRSFAIRIVPRPGDKTDWSRYETKYISKPASKSKK